MEQTDSIEDLSLEELTGKLAGLSPVEWSKYEAASGEDKTGSETWREYSTTLAGKLITLGKKIPETYHFKAISPDDLEDGKVTDIAITLPSTLPGGTYRLGVDRSKWYEEERNVNLWEEKIGGIGKIFERVNSELKGYE